MAATLTTTKSTAGYVDPKLGMFGGVVSVTDNLNTDTNLPVANRIGLDDLIWHVTDIGDADTIAFGIPNIVAVFWQSEDASDDLVTVSLTTQATGTVTFKATNAANAGWILLKVGANVSR
ncbi:MAG: hypothetical protein V3U39_06995 [Acidimicrobiia bacterium]